MAGSGIGISWAPVRILKAFFVAAEDLSSRMRTRATRTLK